ncbi:MAG: hypothetical protein HC851_15420 [Acaryochloris sp. RU_4_1]|nr:hypothetical protein [Acaryochloris sp. RU_4_1]
MLKLLNLLSKPWLTNLQRQQALFVMSVMGGVLFVPHRAFAQRAPLENGAGDFTGGGQCEAGFWFLRNINSFIATTLGGLGGADQSLCRIINLSILASVIAVIAMVLWAVVDHFGNQTPIKKAFAPFVGWITGVMVVWMIIGVTFLGSSISGNSNSSGVI